LDSLQEERRESFKREEGESEVMDDFTGETWRHTDDTDTWYRSSSSLVYVSIKNKSRMAMGRREGQEVEGGRGKIKSPSPAREHSTSY
jgi:hypothetical protein